MKKKQADALGGVLVLGLIAGAVGVWGHVTLKAFLTFSLALVALYWLLVIVTVPWNLYYRARVVRHEIDESRARGLHVPESREQEVTHLARRLWWAAVAGHVISAGVVALVTYASGHSVGYYFAGFYLVSTAFRPAAAYFGYLKLRISALLKETKFPRDDVLELQSKLVTLDANLEAHRLHATEALERTSRELDGLRDDLRDETWRLRDELRVERESYHAANATAQTRVDEVAQHVTALKRHFDEAVDGVSDQRELIAGIRAFVRMVKEAPPA